MLGKMLKFAIKFCMENHFYMLGGEVKRQAKVQKLAEARVGRVDTLPSQGLIFKSKAAQMALKWASFDVDCLLLQWKAKQGFFSSNC